ncbi:MAG: hypothetical protein ABIH52_00140 [Candidatus Aenigmatarchaeota archaeon]|nr:hypothetical protein [Nanoarchaeota archaeon]
MNKKKIVAVAMILLLITLPSYAAGEETIPYVNIEYPTDGQTVGETVNLIVEAEGYELSNPLYQ